jgi:hypothetical protein
MLKDWVVDPDSKDFVDLDPVSEFESRVKKK